jgi:hypothetical protein
MIQEMTVARMIIYGEGQSVGVFSESYILSMGNWAGFVNRSIPSTGSWRPPQSCAKSFVLVALARTTNGYNWIGNNQKHRNLTLLL